MESVQETGDEEYCERCLTELREELLEAQRIQRELEGNIEQRILLQRNLSEIDQLDLFCSQLKEGDERTARVRELMAKEIGQESRSEILNEIEARKEEFVRLVKSVPGRVKCPEKRDFLRMAIQNLLGRLEIDRLQHLLELQRKINRILSQELQRLGTASKAQPAVVKSLHYTHSVNTLQENEPQSDYTLGLKQNLFTDQCS